MGRGGVKWAGEAAGDGGPTLIAYLHFPQKPCEVGDIFLIFKMRKLTFKALKEPE